MNQTIPEGVTGLLNNSPWAIAAFFLGRTILNAWGQDRAQLTELLTNFKVTLDRIGIAVEHLTEKLEKISPTETSK